MICGRSLNISTNYTFWFSYFNTNQDKSVKILICFPKQIDIWKKQTKINNRSRRSGGARSQSARRDNNAECFASIVARRSPLISSLNDESCTGLSLNTKQLVLDHWPYEMKQLHNYFSFFFSLLLFCCCCVVIDASPPLRSNNRQTSRAAATCGYDVIH